MRDNRKLPRQISAAEVAKLVKGNLIGDPDKMINHLAAIDSGGPHSLSYLDNIKYNGQISSDFYQRTIIVSQDFEGQMGEATLIQVKGVLDSWTKVVEYVDLLNDGMDKHQISPQSKVHQKATIGQNVHIGHFTIVSSDSNISDDAYLGDQVFIGQNVHIGKGTRLMPGVKILDDVSIGDHCLVQSNSVIGGTGFGFYQNNNRYVRIPHIGRVIVMDHVEIGSNVCIDRGAIDDTIVNQGVKLDNHVHVAHGVTIGQDTAIAAQTGISGSTKIGAYCRVGGQVGFIGHLEIADGSQIQAQSGVATNLEEPNRKWYGYPAIEYLQYLRSFALFKKLPSIVKRIQILEDKLNR